MGDLSDRDVEDVLEGVQPPGRDDLAPVVELTTWLHASREIEPPPAMREDLFTQIEAGLQPSHRSSRRAPAHLRRHGSGTRRSGRQAVAGSGRPLVSVAAAAALLVGVIFAVRAGGPDRGPSAYVSPSAQGGSATGADAPTTTAAPTTTPSDAAGSSGNADTSVADDEPSTTDGTSRRPTTSAGASSADRGSLPDDDAAPPTTDRPRRASDDDGQAASENPSSAGRRRPSSATSPPTAGVRWREQFSGWDFDLSEWPVARELWDAVGDTGESRIAGDPDDDAPNGDDDDQGRERRNTGERDRGSARDGVSDDSDVGDDGPVEDPGDAPPG